MVSFSLNNQLANYGANFVNFWRCGLIGNGDGVFYGVQYYDGGEQDSSLTPYSTIRNDTFHIAYYNGVVYVIAEGNGKTYQQFNSTYNLYPKTVYIPIRRRRARIYKHAVTRENSIVLTGTNILTYPKIFKNYLFIVSLFCTLGKHLIKWDYKLTTLYAILTSSNLVFDSIAYAQKDDKKLRSYYRDANILIV